MGLLLLTPQEVVPCFVDSAVPSFRTCSKQMHAPGIRPNPQTHGQVVTGFRKVIMGQRTLGSPIMIPGTQMDRSKHRSPREKKSEQQETESPCGPLRKQDCHRCSLGPT